MTTRNISYMSQDKTYMEILESDDDLVGDSDLDEGLEIGYRSTDRSQYNVRNEEGLRDVDMKGIFVRRILKSSKASKSQRRAKREGNTRVYDNFHACLYCGEMRLHINTHMKVHRDIPQVKKILDSAHPDFTEVRKLGDHRHNKKVLKEGLGEIILSRRPDDVFNVSHYGPCVSCKEWMLLKNLKRHHDICSKNKKPKRELIIMAQVETGFISSEPSKLMLTEVFPSMQRDEVTMVAQKDQAIVSLGESWLRRCIDNRLKRKYYASSHMRLMASVLTEIRKLDGDSNKSFSDYLNPRHFDNIVVLYWLFSSPEPSELL